MPSEPEIFDCAAQGCREAHYEDELWTCHDCGCFFCEEHIRDVFDEYGERFLGVTESSSVYLCEGCATARSRKRPGRRRERDENADDDYEDVA